MSETQENNQPESKSAAGSVQLGGLFAFKVGMSAIFNENGERVPVTVLKYEPMVVSQVKTKEKDGYDSLQVAFVPTRATRANAAKTNHLKNTGFENGARFVRELRDQNGEVSVGQKVGIDSLKKGDVVKVT